MNNLQSFTYVSAWLVSAFSAITNIFADWGLFGGILIGFVMLRLIRRVIKAIKF